MAIKKEVNPAASALGKLSAEKRKANGFDFKAMGKRGLEKRWAMYREKNKAVEK